VKYAMVAMLAATVGCEPITAGGLSLRPTPALPADSVSRAISALAASIARRHRLEPTSIPSEPRWQCFGRLGFSVCWMPTESGAEFRFADGHSGSGLGGPIKYEFTDGLQHLFGVAAVRHCEWRDHKCVVLAQTP